MSDKTISPEIVKLMDKLTQNPTSRLFVPLAEEYLKCGMVDEAVIVLVEGIKNHPSYVAARVMLGKIYLQKNQIREAQTEFEQVIAVNPDNILAQKKLATIYQGQGELQRALDACKRVLMIDPSDKEAKGRVGALETASAAAAPSQAVASPPSPPLVAEAGPADPTPSVAPSLSAEETSAPAPLLETPIEAAVMAAEFPPAGEEISFGGLEDLAAEVSESQNQPAASEAAPGEASIRSSAVAQQTPAVQEEEWEGDKTVVAGFDLSSLGAPSSSSEAEALPTGDEDRKEKTPLSTTLASLYMSQGHYQEAADVYQKLLARDPSDDESRQGLEKALRFLAPEQQGGEKVSPERTGADDPKNKRAQRLQSWLDSIRKKNEP